MLETINNLDDVKYLKEEQLELLAKEMRERIIQVCSKNGGHIAPSLGTVELTIALLRVFSPPKDKIVWDVGHQSYGYKILTGRNKKFETLRKFGGISGFSNIFESPFDAFSVGHASTSISAALGLTISDEILDKDGLNIAVIGDGAMTGGLSFEAINHVGHLQKRVVIILNDNQMSISKNIGALQKSLTNILVSKSYNLIKKEVWDISHRLPDTLGQKIIKGSKKIQESIKNIFVPNIFFEELGFRYIGPIDGHNIERVTSILQKVKDYVPCPVVIHLISQKGRGYHLAENDPSRFHGISKFNLQTGETQKSTKKSYSQVFGSTLCKIARQKKDVVAITAAMTDGVGLTDFAKQYKNRFFDVGIAEGHAAVFAAGLAKGGLKPFVAIYSTFLQRSLDQLIHDVALQKLPVVFCLDRAGLVGEDGATHHGVFDLSYLRFIPNMTIFAPSCKRELEDILHFAADFKKGPLAIRYPRGQAADRDIKPIVLGEPEIVENGKDIVIATIGSELTTGQRLNDMLRQNGYEPYLINQRFLKPNSPSFWQKITRDIKTIITIENAALFGGFGQMIKSDFCNSDIKVYSFGIGDKFVPHGDVTLLTKSIGLTEQQIFKQIKDNI